EAQALLREAERAAEAQVGRGEASHAAGPPQDGEGALSPHRHRGDGVTIHPEAAVASGEVRPAPWRAAATATLRFSPHPGLFTDRTGGSRIKNLPLRSRMSCRRRLASPS